jgi:hypothetical protein
MEKYLQSVGYVPGQFQLEDCGIETGGESRGVISPEMQEIQNRIQFLGGGATNATRESDPGLYEALDELGVLTGRPYAPVQKHIDAFCASLAQDPPEPQATENIPLDINGDGQVDSSDSLDECKKAQTGSCIRMYPVGCERLKRWPTGILMNVANPMGKEFIEGNAQEDRGGMKGRAEWIECPEGTGYRGVKEGVLGDAWARQQGCGSIADWDKNCK